MELGLAMLGYALRRELKSQQRLIVAREPPLPPARGVAERHADCPETIRRAASLLQRALGR